MLARIRGISTKSIQCHNRHSKCSTFISGLLVVVSLLRSAVKMKTTEIAFFVSTVFCVSLCVCLFCHLGVSLLMRPKKLVFIVTQGQQSQSRTHSVQLLSFCLYFIRFTISVSLMTPGYEDRDQGLATGDRRLRPGHVRSFRLNVCAFCGRL